MTDPDHIFNWRRLDHRVTTSGQPSEAELAEVAALGVRHVINLGLHTHPRALANEAASVAAQGMGYIHIPVDFGHPPARDFERFKTEFMALEDQPVHVHCIANYRVSAFFYRYRRVVLGMTAAEAQPDLIAIWRPDAVWTAFIESDG